MLAIARLPGTVTMDNPQLRTPFGQIELRAVAAPAGAPAGMRVYVLLPDLDELVGVPGFGLRRPIMVRCKTATRPDNLH